MDGEYLAFLLRLQRGEGQTQWRASVQNAQTGEITHFATERDLLRYLRQILTITPSDTGGQEIVSSNPNPGDNPDV